MKAVGLLLDLYLLLCSLFPIAIGPPTVPPAELMFIPMLLFPPGPSEPFPYPLAELFAALPTTDPAPNRFGCLREFKIYCVFIADE